MIQTNAWTDEDGFYDDLFYRLVITTKPERIVELGTYAGHSANCFARGLKDIGSGHLDCWDLWEHYPYNKVPKSEALKNLGRLPVTLIQADAFEAYQNYLPDSVDILMVDISNNGDIFRRILRDWYPIIKTNGKILMEGGSKQRDDIWWMKEFNKRPINPVLSDPEITSKYSVKLYELFPSLTEFTKI